MTDKWDIEFSFKEDWGEAFGLLALCIGVLIGFAAGSAITAYILSLIAGLIFGRQWHRSRKGQRLPWFVVVVGFAVGFLFGSLPYAQPQPLIILFVIGIMLGYYVRKKGVTTVRY
jgi:amino acid transporter